MRAAAPAAPPVPAPFHAATPMPLQEAAESIVGGAEGWGAIAWSLDRDRPLFAIRANDVFVPASNNKVFSTIWALAVLGPTYRFPTDLLRTGPVVDGVLRGDVVLRGSGDPTLGYPFVGHDPLDDLRPMAVALRRLGVREVAGSVMADATIFDSLRFGPRWPGDTGNGVSPYAPRVSGLAFHRNLVRLDLRVAAGRVVVETFPRWPELPVRVEAGVGGGGARATRRPDDDTIRVLGGVGRRGLHRYLVGVARPELLAVAALRQALEEAGIAVRGPLRAGPAPPGAVLVHRHWSAPLATMVPFCNRESDNFFAEHLWKATAARVLGQGSYTRGGVAAAIFFARSAGVPFGQLYQADGSGLSAFNHVSPYAILRALRFADRAPWGPTFHASLAVGGAREGTLRHLFRQPPARGNLHAKTGYIRGVRSLSGYVTARNGERIAFAFLYNGPATSGARAAQERLGMLLATYDGR
jgi:D-alanyl-D-alanine carboxypeptidase/D-alanyl-D-alanine-endopeptidase (penicillin-binding protein 4)